MNSVTIEALVAFPGQLEAHFRLFDRAHWNWAPASWEGVPSEPLTAIEQLCHIRDIEIEGYQVRFRRTLTESNPLLVSIDTEKLTRERQYAKAAPEQVLTAFGQARARTVEMLSAIRHDQLQRPATLEGYGAVTLAALAHYLCSHDQQHLAGLQWLLGKIKASESPNA